MCGLAGLGVLYLEQWPEENLSFVSFAHKNFINLDICAETRIVTVPSKRCRGYRMRAGDYVRPKTKKKRSPPTPSLLSDPHLGDRKALSPREEGVGHDNGYTQTEGETREHGSRDCKNCGSPGGLTQAGDRPTTVWAYLSPMSRSRDDKNHGSTKGAVSPRGWGEVDTGKGWLKKMKKERERGMRADGQAGLETCLCNTRHFSSSQPGRTFVFTLLRGVLQIGGRRGFTPADAGTRVVPEGWSWAGPFGKNPLSQLKGY